MGVLKRVFNVLRTFFLPKDTIFNLPLLILWAAIFWYLAGFCIWLHEVWPNFFTVILAVYGSIFLLGAFWLWMFFIVITVLYRIWAIKNKKKPRL